jgi:hypothetical protein
VSGRRPAGFDCRHLFQRLRKSGIGQGGQGLDAGTQQFAFLDRMGQSVGALLERA